MWLRHLVLAHRSGLNCHPRTVAELGPGDSLGVGLAALLCGCEQYFALDVVKYSNPEVNVSILEELTTLFRERAAIPGSDEFPALKPYLDSLDFPYDALDNIRLERSLEKQRVEEIRRAILMGYGKEISLKYVVPWNSISAIPKESVDMLFSQSVLELIDDLQFAYRAMHLWVKPNGFVSHQIDFGSVGTAKEWNGHWKYSDYLWKLMKGRRPYFPNREQHSTHLKLLQDAGFGIVRDIATESESRFSLRDLAPRFRGMTEDDLVTSDAFIQAVKLERRSATSQAVT